MTCFNSELVEKARQMYLSPPPGHWHKCYMYDKMFFCQNVKCRERFDTLCEDCREEK